VTAGDSEVLIRTAAFKVGTRDWADVVETQG